MKGEAAVLSVHAQRCQSRYFSTTSCMKQNKDKIMIYVAFCGKKSADCLACFKNAVSILVVVVVVVFFK